MQVLEGESSPEKQVRIKALGKMDKEIRARLRMACRGNKYLLTLLIKKSNNIGDKQTEKS